MIVGQDISQANGSQKRKHVPGKRSFALGFVFLLNLKLQLMQPRHKAMQK